MANVAQSKSIFAETILLFFSFSPVSIKPPGFAAFCSLFSASFCFFVSAFSQTPFITHSSWGKSASRQMQLHHRFIFFMSLQKRQTRLKPDARGPSGHEVRDSFAFRFSFRWYSFSPLVLLRARRDDEKDSNEAECVDASKRTSVPRTRETTRISAPYFALSTPTRERTSSFASFSHRFMCVCVHTCAYIL